MALRLTATSRIRTAQRRQRGREMGGDLSVTSDGIGQGATFNLDLPLSNVTAAEEMMTQRGENRSMAIELAEDRRRILVIDDNGAIHEDFRKTLEQCGESSQTLANARAALFGEPAAAAPRAKLPDSS